MNSIKNEERKAYRNIFKATSLFGSVQIFKILIEIIKQKIIAILLGPTGMGISGLYLSTTSLIQGLTSMGLSTSAVKNIAEASGSKDNQRISKTITVLRKLVWGTGLLGMIVVIILSPLLSKLTFGNYDYTISFIFLSVSLLFNQLSAGQSVILQGLRKLKYLAKSSALGSFFGLVISAPIYYLLGIKGIVPTLILSSITMLGLTWYFSKRIKIKEIIVSPKETILEGKDMLKMGLVMSLNSILVLGIAYLIRIFIMKIGGSEEVGLYTAGFTLVNGYVGLIFTAMGSDYYPRLAEVNKDDLKCKSMINQQSEIAILILSPIIVIFLLSSPYIIKILYSENFISINTFVQWSIIGIIFKAISWSISLLFIAKGNFKQFLFNEITIKIINLPLFYILYKNYGLSGLGLGYFISNILYFIIIYFSSHLIYKYTFSSSLNKILFFELILVITCFILIQSKNSPSIYIFSVLFAVLCCIYSINLLNIKIDLISLFKKYNHS